MSEIENLTPLERFLPTALSDFCAKSALGTQLVHRVFQADQRALEYDILFGSGEEFQNLTLSDEMISVFRDILEFVEDEDVSRRLQLLLREYQISFSRTRNLLDDESLEQDSYLRQVVVGWAYLYAISETLFDFARRRTQTVNDIVFAVRPSRRIPSDNWTEIDSMYQREIELYQRTFEGLAGG